MAENKFRFPQLSQKSIRKILQHKPLENLNLIDTIENHLRSQRGYVFDMPAPHSSVVLLLSGGLDTVVMWDILMRIYQLHVYPVFLRRGQIRAPIEEASVDFFSKHYALQYPKLFHSPKKLTTLIPPMEIRWDITKFGTYLINDDLECRGIPMYSSLLVNYAVQYAYYLEIKNAIKARTIFCGFMKIDGNNIRYETLTALRMNTMNIIHLTGDTRWQFTSLAIEKELGYFFNKETLIGYADTYHIPIEYAFSCIKFSYFHCGKCIYCQGRKKMFKRCGIKDKTIYLNESKMTSVTFIYNKIKLIITTIRFMTNILYNIGANFIYFMKYRY